MFKSFVIVRSAFIFFVVILSHSLYAMQESPGHRRRHSATDFVPKFIKKLHFSSSSDTASISNSDSSSGSASLSLKDSADSPLRLSRESISKSEVTLPSCKRLSEVKNDRKSMSHGNLSLTEISVNFIQEGLFDVSESDAGSSDSSTEENEEIDTHDTLESAQHELEKALSECDKIKASMKLSRLVGDRLRWQAAYRSAEARYKNAQWVVDLISENKRLQDERDQAVERSAKMQKSNQKFQKSTVVWSQVHFETRKELEEANQQLREIQFQLKVKEAELSRMVAQKRKLEKSLE